MNQLIPRLLCATAVLQMHAQEKRDMVTARQQRRQQGKSSIYRKKQCWSHLTGVIGQQLPMGKIKEGVKNLVPVLSETRQAEIWRQRLL